jgi:hypothetical protein
MNTNEIFIVYMSKYSPSCKQIESKLHYIAPHFNTKFIDVDNPVIRKSILSATTNVIQIVPAIMLFMPQKNTIKVYQGSEVLPILDQAVNMVNAKVEAEQQAQTQEAQTQQEQIPQEREPTEEFVPESVLKRRSTKTIQNSEGKPVSSLDSVFDDPVEEQGEPAKTHKKKIQKGVFHHEYSPTDDTGMISTLKPLPPRGVGHDTMKRSSIPEFNIAENSQEHSGPMGPDFEADRLERGDSIKPKKNVSISNVKTIHIIDDDITEDPEKPQGMSREDILGNQEANISTESKEATYKSNKLKATAEELMNARKNMI